MSITEYLERILSVAKERAGFHSVQEDDGTMSFTSDYGVYVSIIDDATEALTKLPKATGD